MDQGKGGGLRDDELEQALCAQTDPAIFFPDKGAPLLVARSICLGCDVRRACLVDVLSSPQEEHGMWAALVPQQRKLLRLAIARAEGDPVLIEEIIDEGMRLAENRPYLTRAERQRQRRARAIAALGDRQRLRDAA